MSYNIPTVIYITDIATPAIASTFFTDTLKLFTTNTEYVMAMSDECAGIILDVVDVTDQHFHLLQTYAALSHNLGLTIVSESCDPHLHQSLSLLFHTVLFTRTQLLNNPPPICAEISHFFQSVSKRREYENSLKEKAHYATNVETLGVIAHQWRQPLHLISLETINLVVQATINTTVSSSDIRKSADLISEQSQRMSNILNSILKIGQDRKIKTLFSIHSVMQTLNIFFKDRLDEKNITISIDIREAPELYGFKVDLEEVLINLLSNAIDAFDTVSIEVPKKIFFTLIQENGQCNFYIKDNAGGVPEALVEKIFEANFSTKQKGKGFGIGLHIARLIIEQEFGGTLTLKTDSQGSEFIISLPQQEINNVKFVH
ncbi:MAG: HAMP domain-containing sensor histidine kinase [Sulfurimonas sp.]